MEKAHPDVFNILLQVLDDGRLTDSQGRTVDFRNTVIVMTSNLGSDVIQELTQNKSFDAISFDGEKPADVTSDDVPQHRYQAIKSAVMEIVSKHFRPEFINRLDEAVVFHPLERQHIRSIASIQIDILKARLAERDIALTVSDAALDQLGNVGFDPVYGARPLKRAIQQYLENPLAQALLAGEYAAGDTINVDVKGGDLHFNKA